MGDILLGVGVNSTVILPVEYSASFSADKVEYTHRSLSGKLYRYNVSNFKKWQLPVTFVSSNVANIVNSWWAANTALIFSQDSSVNNWSSVQIINNEMPLNQFESGNYYDYFKGTVNIEEY